MNNHIVQKEKKSKQKQKKKLSPRIAATLIISQLLKQQGSLANLLPKYAEQYSAQDKSFIKELCYGCCRWYPQLNLVLEKLLKQPLKPKETDIKAVLLLGIYQLQFMRIAEHAAINESVNAAVVLKKIWAKKLINAILRSYQRQNTPQKDQEDFTPLFNQIEKQCVSAHPRWLEKKITQSWPEYASNIFTANNQHPPFVLRVNQKIQTRDEYLAKLSTVSISAKKAAYSEQGIYLDSPCLVDELPDFFNGAVSVQDEAAQLAATLLKLKPGHHVLDACAAPGGKTCHIGECEPKVELTAVDIEQKRLIKVKENIDRLNINAEIICGDAAQPSNWSNGQTYDRILLDAPCSATGIIRRQPDIKLLRQPEHIQALIKLQLKLLKALWPLLNDGGILLYATCSILPDENTHVVEQFLASEASAVHDIIEHEWGIKQTCGRQLLPVDNTIKGAGHDGFYYARLVKQSEPIKS